MCIYIDFITLLHTLLKVDRITLTFSFSLDFLFFVKIVVQKSLDWEREYLGFVAVLYQLVNLGVVLNTLNLFSHHNPHNTE